jgi:hypothetical protein
MSELFDVDLANDTLTRVSASYRGGAGEHPHEEVLANEEPYTPTDGALSPSFSGDGNLLAFASTASNFVYGDGNTPAVGVETRGSADGSDVFTVTRRLFGPTPTEAYVSPAPAGPTLTPDWRVAATAVSLPNGTVRVYVQVPGAGSVKVLATGAVPVPRSSRARQGRGRGRSSATTRRPGMTIAERAVAKALATTGASSGGLVVTTLRLAPGYRSLASRRGGLSGTASILFAAPGHAAAKARLTVHFINRSHSRRSKRSPSSHGRRP